MSDSPLRIGTVLFERFELLDVFGPLEMFGVAPGRFDISLIGPQAGPLASSQGPRSHVDYAYADAPPVDIVLVPGGIGRLWVVDRIRWTSSGVAAGIDMSLALIGHLHGDDLAQRIANGLSLIHI